MEEKPAWMRKTATNAALSLLAMIAIGYVLHWRSRDLIWGLWLSSLCLGALVFVARYFFWPVINAKTAVARMKAIVVGVLSLLFFTFHFGGFHFIQSYFFSMFFPMEGMVFSAEGIIGMYEKIALTYWPAALINVWAQKDLLYAMEDTNSSTDSVYTDVVKMHLMIFVLAAFTTQKTESFLVYAVVCALYFFPFELLMLFLPPISGGVFQRASSRISQRFDKELAKLINRGNAAYDEGNAKAAGELWRSALRNIEWGESTGRRVGLRASREDVEARLARLTTEQMEKGNLYFREEKLPEAIAAWEAILAYDPENREAAKAVWTAKARNYKSEKNRAADKPADTKDQGALAASNNEKGR